MQGIGYRGLGIGEEKEPDRRDTAGPFVCEQP